VVDVLGALYYYELYLLCGCVKHLLNEQLIDAQLVHKTSIKFTVVYMIHCIGPSSYTSPVSLPVYETLESGDDRLLRRQVRPTVNTLRRKEINFKQRVNETRKRADRWCVWSRTQTGYTSVRTRSRWLATSYRSVEYYI